MIRRALPFLLVPLGMLAVALSGTPWLRAYPSSALAVPLVGAAALSILVPVVVVGIGVRRLWLTALIDMVIYLFFTTFVGLHDPIGLTGVYDGLIHGPSQILSFALPLVSPRTLLVAPITLCWVAGAVVGECLARGWHSVLPYATLLVAFGLAYGGSVRGVASVSDGRRYDVLLAAALLLTMLVMRAIEAWIEQDLDSEVAQPDGRLPLRGLALGLVVAVLVTGAAGAVVRASAFSGPPVTPNRHPPLDRGAPLSPVAFIAGLRPRDVAKSGTPLFSLRVDRATSSYVAIADVDDYDGEGWTFDRTFRPSGGAIPGESDPSLNPSSPPVTQQYTIDAGALTRTPWMPFLYRPRQVTGTAVDVDSDSGMIVPGSTLRAHERYSIVSAVPSTGFASLPPSSLAATSAPPAYTFVPGDVSSSLGTVISSFENETRTQDTDPIAFLQAISRDFEKNYVLSGVRPAQAATSPSPAPSTRTHSSTPRSPTHKPSGPRPSTHRPSAHRPSAHRPSAHRSTAARTARPTPSPTPTPSASTSAGRGAPATGGTGFATVLASILGPNRAATPEQYATLVALIARQLGLPARLVTGFRVGDDGGSLRADHTYDVTTAQAWTWVEIPIAGRGWVVLDPSPSRASTAKQSTKTPDSRARPKPTPTVTPNGLATQSGRGHAVAPKSTVPGGTHADSVSVVLVVIGAVILGILLALGLLWGRKWLRARRRRRTGDPRRRLLGAWQEGLDVLVESGLPDPLALTSAEVAALTEDHFGGEPAAQARYLGDRANTAIFSPTTWIGQGDADAAWHAQRILRRTVRRRLTLRQKVRAHLRYRRVRRMRPLVGPSSWASASRARATRGRHSPGRRRAH